MDIDKSGLRLFDQKKDAWRRQCDLSKLKKEKALLRCASQLLMIILNC